MIDEKIEALQELIEFVDDELSDTALDRGDNGKITYGPMCGFCGCRAG